MRCAMQARLPDGGHGSGGNCSLKTKLWVLCGLDQDKRNTYKPRLVEARDALSRAMNTGDLRFVEKPKPWPLGGSARLVRALDLVQWARKDGPIPDSSRRRTISSPRSPFQTIRNLLPILKKATVRC